MRPNRAAIPGQADVVTGRMAMPRRRDIPGLAGKGKGMTIDRHKGKMGEMAVMAGATNAEETISSRKGLGAAYEIGRVQGKMGQVV